MGTVESTIVVCSVIFCILTSMIAGSIWLVNLGKTKGDVQR